VFELCLYAVSGDREVFAHPEPHLFFAGVQAWRHGQAVEYYARKEVILSAGTVETPLLLERSGIGNAEVLRRAGIEVRVEVPTSASA
jgi:hypothetical protein